MVVLVESNIDHFDNEPLLVCFGSITAVVVGLMLLSMTNTALILVAVLNFDCMASVQLQSLSFEHFWRARCEDVSYM